MLFVFEQIVGHQKHSSKEELIKFVRSADVLVWSAAEHSVGVIGQRWSCAVFRVIYARDLRSADPI